MSSILANATFIDLDAELAKLGKRGGNYVLEYVGTKTGRVSHSYRLQPADNELAALVSFLEFEAIGEDVTDYIMRGDAGFFCILSARQIVRVRPV